MLHVASPLDSSRGGNGRDPKALIGPARDGTLRVLRAAAAAGVRRVVMTSAANAASPSSYTEEGTTDETLWTDPDDPTLVPYRRSKTVAEKAAWDFMAGHGGAMTLTTILPGAVFGRRNRHSTEKARRVLGWQPRPAAETVVDCAKSLIAWKLV